MCSQLTIRYDTIITPSTTHDALATLGMRVLRPLPDRAIHTHARAIDDTAASSAHVHASDPHTIDTAQTPRFAARPFPTYSAASHGMLAFRGMHTVQGTRVVSWPTLPPHDGSRLLAYSAAQPSLSAPEPRIRVGSEPELGSEAREPPKARKWLGSELCQIRGSDDTRFRGSDQRPLIRGSESRVPSLGTKAQGETNISWQFSLTVLL